MPISNHFISRGRFLLSFFILPLVGCPLWGQQWQKKQLKSEDYHLWSTMDLQKSSEDGNWISYSLNYEQDIDTLFIRSVLNSKTYSFTKGYKTTFLNKKYFVCASEGSLKLLNLRNGNINITKDAVEYVVSRTCNRLIILQKSAEGKNILLIKSFSGQVISQIEDITQFALSPKGQYLLYCVSFQKHSYLKLLNLKKLTLDHVILEIDQSISFQSSWQKDDNAFTFITVPDDRSPHVLYYYNLHNRALKKFNPSAFSSFPEHTSVTADNFRKILISSDSERIFFAIKKDIEIIENHKRKNVEIWNANDKWINPQQNKEGSFEYMSQLAVWLPLENRFSQLTTKELPQIMLSGKQDYALLSNPKQYEPQFDYNGPRDYFIMDLNTFDKKLFLKKQEGENAVVIPSPAGKYISYFKNDNWWIYDISKQTHLNLTQKTGVKFKAKEIILAPESPCGIAGWTADDKEIIIYDQYDLWFFDSSGKNYKRLTHGRESSTVFRVASSSSKYLINNLYDGLNSSVISISKGIYLTAAGQDGKTGFYSWTTQKSEEKLFYNDSYTDQFRTNDDGKIFFFSEEKFNLPPRVITFRNKKAQTVFQSNPQFDKYHWGRSELIEFSNSKKERLQSVLLFPADYDATRKYPMIVYIYEQQSHLVHRYKNPSEFNLNGFNPSVLTSKGYFVLLPDIKLEKMRPGISALDCVTAAVKKVESMNIVKQDKIGLAGHSFGGYEASFIVTQTPMFAAVVASGAITDLNSFYYTVGQQSGKPNMWRFKTYQWNMDKAPYEIPTQYDQNSPIRFADKVQTPVLLWTGKDDQIVDPKQSIEFYLALRRASKKSIMLLYPKENHLLSISENQKDITLKMMQWFDYFLKDDISTNWIKEGI